ncbi:MAG TPA: cupredoxin domain-containing protein [bacterium]|nr:cupredoxin domain-containing protein [bacterium]
MRVRIGMLAVIVLVAVVAVACGRGGAPSQPGGQPPAPGGASAMNVDEKEWSITLASTSVKAGPVTFTINNTGAIEHNFVIVETKFEIESTQPGQSKTGTTTLQPGTYTIICNIPGHEEAGMKTTLTVTP